MEILAPAYRALIDIRQRMECGRSVADSIQEQIRTRRNEFDEKLFLWWTRRSHGAKEDFRDLFPQSLQRIFIETLAKGLDGEPILPRLTEVEGEMRASMAGSIAQHLQTLPVKSLLPLMLLVFPAFALLLLGPLLSRLVEELTR